MGGLGKKILVRDETYIGEARGCLADYASDSNLVNHDKRVAMALSTRRHAHVTGHLGVSILASFSCGFYGLQLPLQTQAAH